MEISVTLDLMFKEFFLDNIPGISFGLFSITHILLVVLLFLIIFLFHKYRNNLLNINDNTKRIISLSLVAALFINMSIYYLSLIYYGVYDYRTDLPLHFCFISGYLFMYAVLFNKTNLYKKIYFFAFMGPIPAIFLPDLKSSFDSFIFYQQVISHHFFLISSLFIFYAYNIKISKKDLLEAFKYALYIYLAIFVFNYIFDTNYIMQSKLPDHVIKLFPNLLNFGSPILLLFITGILMMFLALLPIIYKDNKSVYNQVIICYNQVRVLIYSLLQTKPKDHKEV